MWNTTGRVVPHRHHLADLLSTDETTVKSNLGRVCCSHTAESENSRSSKINNGLIGRKNNEKKNGFHRGDVYSCPAAISAIESDIYHRLQSSGSRRCCFFLFRRIFVVSLPLARLRNAKESHGGRIPFDQSARTGSETGRPIAVVDKISALPNRKNIQTVASPRRPFTTRTRRVSIKKKKERGALLMGDR